VTQLHPQALGSLFIASYDSQGCSGGIRTRLHTGDMLLNSQADTLFIEPLCTDCIENAVSSNSSIFTYVFVAAGTGLPSPS
jgi:hypothetical protein